MEDEHADLVRDLFRWSGEGLTPYTISQQLRAGNVTSDRGTFLPPQSIRRILANPSYHTGQIHYRRHARPHEPTSWIPLAVPPLVTEAEWQAAQRPRRGNPNLRRPDVYPLTGHLTCACGSAMNGGRAARKGGYKYTYGCRMGSRNTPKCTVTGRTNHEQPKDLVEERARAALVDVLSSEAALVALMTSPEPATDPHRAERLQLEQRRDTLIDLHVEGLIDRAEFTRRRNELQARITRLQPQVTVPEPDMTLIAGYRQAAERLTGEDYTTLLRELRVKFEVAPDGGVRVLELNVPV
ncbi:recombinase family protein [Deinococcus sp. DB0503]|uniref:recombinase family protein n=1 Tax=Deinococcus sp. DB0503 TaxID=2479203 RepID=UPI00351C14AA